MIYLTLDSCTGSWYFVRHELSVNKQVQYITIDHLTLFAFPVNEGQGKMEGERDGERERRRERERETRG